MSSHRVLIGVCTYQESENIDTLLRRLRESLPQADILVVDDDSPDATAAHVEKLQESDKRLFLHIRKSERGLGSAIVFAVKHAVAQNYHFFLNLDADLSHDPLELPRLLDEAIGDETCDVVIGSRYVSGGRIVGWPLRRRVMSKMVNRFATGVLRLPVADCSGSMRCYRVDSLRTMGLERLRCTSYAVLEEVLVRMHRMGFRMKELPITFTERELGDSKLTISEAFRSVYFMLRLAFQRSG
ncbi:MAG: polyprenol monophosphomannose synthase [Planctomycetota bacterium]